MIKAVLTDIEGTTSSLSFVKEVLFPYARKRMGEFIARHGGEPQVRRLLDEVRALAGEPLDDAALAQELVRWIDEDRKATPLKSLQGLIWEAGYRQGDFQGHLYEDAWHQLKAWHHQGFKLYIFSSGSVFAQKLLFGHTAWGDLTPLFSGYFDTRVGAKREPAAYRRIVEEIGLPAGAILFLSDIVEELDAAKEAGMQTLRLVREGTALCGPHPEVASFDAIDLSAL